MPIVFKRNDTLDALELQLFGRDGLPEDLTAATSVTLTMKLDGATSPKLLNASMTVQDALNGVVSRAWAAGDLDTAGAGALEVEVTFPTGKKTYPTVGQIRIRIDPDLNAA